MVIVAMRVVALSLLALGLWYLGDAIWQADCRFWHFYNTHAGDMEPLLANGGPVNDARQYLVDRGCVGAAMAAIGLGFGFIVRRLSSPSV